MRISFRDVIKRLDELEKNIKEQQKRTQDDLTQKLEEIERIIGDKKSTSVDFEPSNTHDFVAESEAYDDYDKH